MDPIVLLTNKKTRLCFFFCFCYNRHDCADILVYYMVEFLEQKKKVEFNCWNIWI